LPLLLHISALLLLFTLPPSAVDAFYVSGVEINGYYKNFSTIVDLPEIVIPPFYDSRGKPLIGAVDNKLRLKVSTRPLSWLDLNLAYEISPRIQDEELYEMEEITGIETNVTFRVADFERRIYPESEEKTESFSVFHNLDRFSLSLYMDFADIDIGRQTIAWGTARVVNPTDILLPFNYTDLDREERYGVDALRIRVPLGTMSSLDAGYIPPEDFERGDESVYYLRGAFYALATNISAVMMNFRGYGMCGFDLARSIGGAGSWLEVALFDVEDLLEGKNEGKTESHPPDGDDLLEEGFVRVSLGADYSFSDDMYGYFEYHYNGAGETDTGKYHLNYRKIAYREAGVYLQSRHYLSPGVVYQFTPLVTGSMNALWNLNDGSAVVTPLLEYNIRQDVYVSLGGNIGIGRSGFIQDSYGYNYAISGYPPTGKSEFGASSDVYFTSFRVYF
jgi:hypothetical protein